MTKTRVGRPPLHPGKEVVRVGITLTKDEVERLDEIACQMRNTRSNAAALLLIRALRQEGRLF